MRLALCLAGWGACLALGLGVLQLRRRLELMARAAHELRAPATAIALAAATLGREESGRRHARALEVQLDRMRLGLADLELARAGRRKAPRPTVVPLERLLDGIVAGWQPVAGASGRRLRVRSQLGGAAVHADHGRLGQAIANLVSNALEHGSGTVELRGRAGDDRVVVEVRDDGARPLAGAPAQPPAGRGRGLQIAAVAAAEAGGTLTLQRHDDSTVASLELPLAEP